MNLYDNSTYPPATGTQTAPSPPHSVAFSGAPGDIGWMVTAVIVLAVVGATAVAATLRRKSKTG